MTADEFKRALCESARGLIKHEELLTSLDSKIGDGDHGISITKISNIILNECGTDNGDLPSLLGRISEGMTNCSGGSTGPLWGVYFEGLASGASGISAGLNGAEIAHMLSRGCEELCSVSAARIGDKTMMDAVVPSASAAKRRAGEGGGCAEVLRCAADAAAGGAEKTEEMIARFGRAKNLKERSLGCRDAGAVSFSLFLQGLAESTEN